ncbi:MAG: hypothetical protein R3E04_01360 [Sphingobium sp.]
MDLVADLLKVLGLTTGVACDLARFTGSVGKAPDDMFQRGFCLANEFRALGDVSAGLAVSTAE